MWTGWGCCPWTTSSQVLALFTVQIVSALQTPLQQLPVLTAQGLHLGQQLSVLLLLGAPQLREQLAGGQARVRGAPREAEPGQP